ncbi:MAG: DNA-binding response regulator [Crocinitomicaceae bacterium]|jgi:DNA-binding winged helix-turn-helix (wHTH) protein|nr:DNA-binding response regulator [Crocinitomicaceae bacterium]
MVKWKTLLVFCVQGMLFTVSGHAQPDRDEKHTEVTMRLIGHEILLLSGDSTSRVLPVKKEANRYTVSFASEFSFWPEKLISKVDSIVKIAGIGRSYRVELEDCKTGETVYSYEMGGSDKPDLLPCGTRAPSKGCYVFCFTALKKNNAIAALYKIPYQPNETSSGKSFLYTIITGAFIILLVLVVVFLYIRRKNKERSPRNSEGQDIILIGNHRFNKKNMLLTYQDESMQLSGKETDLLLLLYTHENKTLQRDHILKIVWEDEGDYIGRTLDVFISKLRKKLEADPAVRIMNIRGVGYKLVVTEN